MAPSAPRKTQIFLSYSHGSDEPVAEWLQARLGKLAARWAADASEEEAVELTVFRDESHIGGCADLPGRLQQALEASDWMIFLASPNSADSYWCRVELDTWLEPEGGGSGPDEERLSRLFIAQAGGEIHWAEKDFDWERTTALPSSLQGVFSREPLWVDLRSVRSRVRGRSRDLPLRGLAALFDLLGLPRGWDPGGLRAAAEKQREELARLLDKPLDVDFPELRALALAEDRRANRRQAGVVLLLSTLLALLVTAVMVGVLRERQSEEEAARVAVQDALAEDLRRTVSGGTYSPGGGVEPDLVSRAYERLARDARVQDLGLLPYEWRCRCLDRDALVLAGEDDRALALDLTEAASSLELRALGAGEAQPVLETRWSGLQCSCGGARAAWQAGVGSVVVEPNPWEHGYADSATLGGSLSRAGPSLSPDGTRLAVVDELEEGGARAIVLEVSTDTVLRTCDLDPPAKPAGFSPEGELLALRTADGLRLWPWERDEKPFALQQGVEGCEYPYFLAFAPDGQAVLTLCRDGIHRLWDTRSGALLRALEASSGRGTFARDVTAAFGPDGQLVATASGTWADEAPWTVVHVWDREAGLHLNTAVFLGSRGLGLAFEPEASQLIVATEEDRAVRLWRWNFWAGARELLVAPACDPAGSGPYGWDGTLVSADGRFAAYSDQASQEFCVVELAADGWSYLVELPTVLHTLGGVHAFHVDQEAGWLRVAAGGSSLLSYRLRSGDEGPVAGEPLDLGEPAVFDELRGGEGLLAWVRFSADGARLAWGTREDGNTSFLRAVEADGQPVLRLPVERLLWWQRHPADPELLALQEEDGSLAFWHAPAEEEPRQLCFLPGQSDGRRAVHGDVRVEQLPPPAGAIWDHASGLELSPGTCPVKLPEDLALPGYELSWRDSSRELEVLEPWTGGAQLRLRLLDTWHVSQAWLGPSSTSLLALDAQGRFHRWTLLPPAPTDAVELLNAACRAEGSDAAHPFCQGLREELAAREERCWTRPIEPVFPDDATDRERMHPLEVWIDGQQLGHVSTHLSHERAVRPGQRVLLKGDCSRGEYVAPEEPEGCEAWLRDAPTLRVPMERRACDEPPR